MDYRIITYVRAEGSGFQISVTSTRANVEHSIPLTDVETGEAATREDALRVRAELVGRVIARIRERGDNVILVREIGDIDR